MYFFLCNLSFNDISLSTSIIPKMLVNIQVQDQSITYSGCLTQSGLVIVFGYLENFLLAVMAYDRYVAIYHPLRYKVIMNLCLCVLLVMVSMCISIVVGLLHSVMVLHLSFCRALEIPHFFCEFTQFIKLTCSDTLFVNILVYISSCMFGGVSISGIIFFYVHIVSSVLRMPSSGGKHKAFSTCGSHLLDVSLFYGRGFVVYISSSVTDYPRKTAVASVMYSVVPQMLKPFIYSLRNRDMKDALRKFLGRIAFLVRYFLLFDLGFSDRIMTSISHMSLSHAAAAWAQESAFLVMLPIFGFRFIVSMEPRNNTAGLEFLLLELTEDPALQSLLFSLFLSVYLVTVLGNLLIILAVSFDSHLHTPMYFFLSNLSFTDICLSTSTIPKSGNT
ncbi:Olfactory receptor 7G1 [Sciurus carolinensis]|uniref:Olfactory receptor n=1 Tax=Sciurus carolinensis TaxID=30640 RepID=A0AA41N6X0_SCICA|nr:Olfactory receptor 7G1 [Sciurus carolinensis]